MPLSPLAPRRNLPVLGWAASLALLALPCTLLSALALHSGLLPLYVGAGVQA